MILHGTVFGIRNAFFVVCFLLCSGCATEMRFKVVDARSEMPLSDVRVTLDAEMEDLVLGYADDKTSVGSTNSDGLTMSVPLNASRSNSLTFEKQGYSGACAHWSGGSDVFIATPSSSRLDIGGPGSSIQKIRDVIVVKMFPLSATGPTK